MAREIHPARLAEGEMQQVNLMLDFVGYNAGTIPAVAATIGAADSLHAVVENRRRELATLRAT